MMAILQLPSDSLRTKAENSLNISSFESIFLVKKLLENGLFTPLPQEVFSALYACVLFGDKHITTQFSGTGFSDWKHASSRLIDHENSAAHHSAQVAYSSQRQVCGRIDCEIGKQLEAEKRYWHDIIKRVVAVIKFLSERDLPFRGDNEILNSPHNGIYLGVLELISKFDPFLRNHIETYGNKGKGRPSYLSTTICEEFIEIMGSTVLSVIITVLKEAKYFSLSVDSTPDLCHVDHAAYGYSTICK